MGEILIYSIVAIGTLISMGFSVHMFVGGLVSQETEYFLIAAVCLIVACIMSYMAWDVIQKRKGNR